VILGFAAPLLYLAFRTGKVNYETEKEAVKHERRAGYLQEVLTSRDYTEERSLFGYTGELNKIWYDKYEAARKIRVKAHMKLMLSLKGSSVIILFTAALIIGVLFAPLGSGAISTGMFMGFVTAVFNLTFLIGNELVWFTGQVAKDREYLKDLAAFSCLSEHEGALSFPEASVPEPGLIELVNVSFRYPGTDRDILKNLSLKFLGGRRYALVGANGAGKTTIAKLLTGLYTNYEGEILIDGTELRRLPAARIKALFCVVYQDFAKYQIPLKDAVTLGAVTGAPAPDAPALMAGEKAAREALEKIGLGSLPAELPRGMDTPLGRIREGGVDISGGQWQRVAIARSLASPAPVRILDEPTASLDPVAESALYELYGEISRGKTTVVITHRLGAARRAGEILVIDGGRVAEKGSHDALMAEGGLYAAMYESQRGWYQHEGG
jgi:ATP-binding cassette subfamily B protein